ncbi:hypothetical protein [Microbacterium binotii]|uniref:hypothetical protein n=1 Tax=Microbacterium binotii TaxID=462710 RepID=UPI001F18365D|nr:hypothetical protein [Microbacterium binotii]UIN30525.1 hypothetical protein LXM64_15485 [Microbacterium binotii]
MPALDRIFLHFFDTHYLEATASRVDKVQLYEEMVLATRIAILAARQVLIPASSYFESPLCRRIIDELQPLFTTGAVKLVGGATGVDEFIESKLLTYDPGGAQFSAYTNFRDGNATLPPFSPRNQSATRDITKGWFDVASQPDFEADVFGRARDALDSGFAERWAQAPVALGGRAFTPEYVQPLVAPPDAPATIGMRIGNVINRAYFSSFAFEFHAGFVTNMSVLTAAHGLDNRFGNLDYVAVREELRSRGLMDQVLDSSALQLVDLRDDNTVAMAILSGVSTIDLSVLHSTNLRLDIPIDLSPAVKKMRAIKPGAKAATAYHHTVADILDDIFVASLFRVKLEQEIYQGRKRVDISYLNIARTGIFNWLHLRYGAPLIYVECKNYNDDPKNREFDQLAARFSTQGTRVGLLLCRRVDDKKDALARARDAFHAGNGLIIVLDDDDVESLAALDRNMGYDLPQGKFLRERIMQVIS